MHTIISVTGSRRKDVFFGYRTVSGLAKLVFN
jgi:hypothetical protein